MLPDSGTAAITAPEQVSFFVNNPGTTDSIVITKSAGGGTATLNLNTPQVTYQFNDSNDSFQLDSNTITASNAGFNTFDLFNNNACTINGTLLSVVANARFDFSQSGNFGAVPSVSTIQGNGTISMVSGGVIDFSVDQFAADVRLNIGGNLTLDPGSGGVVFLQCGDGGFSSNVGTLTFTGGNLQILSGAGVLMSSDFVDFQIVSKITASGASAIQFSNTPGFDSPLTQTYRLTAPSGGSAEITTGAGGSILVTNRSGNLDFNKTGVGNTTYNFKGGPLTVDNLAGNVRLLAQSAGGVVNFTAGTATTVANNGSVLISAPRVQLESSQSITAGSITVDAGAAGNNLLIESRTGGAPALNANTISIAPAAGQSLTFSQTAAGAATLDLNGKTTITVVNAAMTINTGVTVSSNNSITANLNGTGSLTNNGMLRSSASGNSITIQSDNTLTLNGSLGSISQTNAVPGTTSFLAASAAGSITVAPGFTLTIAGGGPIRLGTPSLVLGAGATVTGASSVSIDSGGGANSLTITSPDNSSATITTTGGAISIAPTAGQSLAFAKSAGAGVTTLNLNGGAVTATTNNANTVINASVTVSSNNTSFTLNANSASLVGNGTVTTSAANGVLAVSSTGALGLSGNGTLSAPSGTVTVTATGANALTLSGNNKFVSGSGIGQSVNWNAATGRTVLSPLPRLHSLLPAAVTSAPQLTPF